MSSTDEKSGPSSSKELKPSEDKEVESPSEQKSTEEDKNDEIGQVIERLPPENRKMVSTMLRASYSGPMPNPIFEKFTEKHIDKFLDYTQKDDDNSYKFRCSNRWFILAYVLLCIAIFVFLVLFLLPNNRDLLIELLKLFVAFAGGLGSGFGIKAWLDRK